jgi:pyridoxal phosphate enzyme (YggS family)
MEEATAGGVTDLAARLLDVRERIGAAAERSGRRASDVTLIAVSKTVAPAGVLQAIEAGVEDLGENRVQEAEGKIPALPGGVRWHLIGHLQRNKVNKALELFALIHSVDTIGLARSIGERAARRGQRARVLLQVNLAQKESQSGFAAEALAAAAPELAGSAGLELDGLMCIAPEATDAEQTRPYFRRLAELHRTLEARVVEAGHPWRHLSMGMTNDYPVAIEEGATLVRVGRAIFGERPAAMGTEAVRAGAAGAGGR